MTEDNDHKLFSAAMEGVKPLSGDRQQKPASEAGPAREKPKPIPRQQPNSLGVDTATNLSSELVDSTIDAADELRFRRDGVQPRALRKLSRGHYAIGDEIDFHGMTSPEAQRYLSEFLDYALDRQYEAVRLVHGKGKHSENGPVIKRLIGGWLRQRTEVLAFVSAPVRDGGAGALYVLLKN